MTGCDGFCTAAFPWWIVAMQLFAIAALVANTYIGGF
jgi:hypothetical protein